MPEQAALGRVAGVVLAAGEGRRFGRPKALVRFRGSMLVERAAGTLSEAGCDPVLVVLGAAADTVTSEARLGPATAVVNPDWATGMASSLRLALSTLVRQQDRWITSALVLPVDMPGVTASAARRVAAHASPSALVAATYDGVRGHPVLLGRDHWAGIADSATGDSGAREYLRSHPALPVACEDVGAGFDVDRPHDLWRRDP